MRLPPDAAHLFIVSFLEFFWIWVPARFYCFSVYLSLVGRGGLFLIVLCGASAVGGWVLHYFSVVRVL